MRKRKRQTRTAVAVIHKWLAHKTPLFCIAALLFAPHVQGPMIRIAKGIIEIINFEAEQHAILKSSHGSFVVLGGWSNRASVEVFQDWQGARIEVIFDEAGGLVIADYDFTASPAQRDASLAQSADPMTGSH